MKPPYDCQKVLDRLMKGKEADFDILEPTEGQQPFAVVLSCADSRVIPEQIFNTKPGELFVIRVAGNIANPETIASIEYAVAILKVGVVIVMGHESCGAVQAAMQYSIDHKIPSPNLNQLVSYIVPGIEPGADPKDKDDVKAAVWGNANHTVEVLREQSTILRETEGLMICSAYYNLAKQPEGKQVDFAPSCTCNQSGTVA